MEDRAALEALHSAQAMERMTSANLENAKVLDRKAKSNLARLERLISNLGKRKAS